MFNAEFVATGQTRFMNNSVFSFSCLPEMTSRGDMERIMGYNFETLRTTGNDHLVVGGVGWRHPLAHPGKGHTRQRRRGENCPLY